MLESKHNSDYPKWPGQSCGVKDSTPVSRLPVIGKAMLFGLWECTEAGMSTRDVKCSEVNKSKLLAGLTLHTTHTEAKWETPTGGYFMPGKK